MIIDTHVHAGRLEHWDLKIFGTILEPYGTSVKVLDLDPVVTVKKMEEAGIDKACLLALDAPAHNTHIPNEYVAGIVQEFPEKFIGFASVDPHKGKHAADELEYAYKVLGMRGLKLGGIYQMYHPADPIAFPVYAKAQELGMPIVFHQAWTRMREAPMKWMHPELLDDVALAFPDLRIILAHIGIPWQVEALHLAAKQPNVYVDISARDAVGYGGGLVQLFRDLVLARNLMIMDKVFFGSDFPWTDPVTYLEQVRNINQFGAKVDESPLTSEEIKMITGDNALKMLGELEIL
jgi:predicted TIM-barrel fold metal-dependent hydrolase